jgi:hypothetical protein
MLTHKRVYKTVAEGCEACRMLKSLGFSFEISAYGHFFLDSDEDSTALANMPCAYNDGCICDTDGCMLSFPDATCNDSCIIISIFADK